MPGKRNDSNEEARRQQQPGAVAEHLQRFCKKKRPEQAGGVQRSRSKAGQAAFCLGNQYDAVGSGREMAIEAREKIGRHMSQSSSCELRTMQRLDLPKRAIGFAAIESGDPGGLAEHVGHGLLQTFIMSRLAEQ
jgi:hypothetical protein